MQPLRRVVIAAAVVALASAPTRVWADAVPISPSAAADATESSSFRYLGRAGNPSVRVTVNGVTYDGSTDRPRQATGPFYWDNADLPPNALFPPPTLGFCIEVSPSQPLPFPGAVVDFAVLPVSALANSALITELYGRFYNNTPGQNWENPVPQLGGTGTFNGSNTSTAFQLAVWELVYDSNRDLSGGNFIGSGLGTVSTIAQDWLNSLNGDLSMFNSRFAGQELVVLSAPAGSKAPDNIQDQLTLRPIPAPPGVLLAGMGFLALLGGRVRWARRRPLA